MVTSVNPPADLEARTNGKIVRLFVNDNELVKSGDVLAMIENPAAYEDVMLLKKELAFLDSIRIEDDVFMDNIDIIKEFSSAYLQEIGLPLYVSGFRSP